MSQVCVCVWLVPKASATGYFLFRPSQVWPPPFPCGATLSSFPTSSRGIAKETTSALLVVQVGNPLQNTLFSLLPFPAFSISRMLLRVLAPYRIQSTSIAISPLTKECHWLLFSLQHGHHVMDRWVSCIIDVKGIAAAHVIYTYDHGWLAGHVSEQQLTSTSTICLHITCMPCMQYIPSFET